MKMLKGLFPRWLRLSLLSLALSFTAIGSAQAVSIALIEGSSGRAALNLDDIVADRGDGSTWAGLTALDFNATSAADLRATYDVLVFGWTGVSTTDADWATKLLPYLELGGGIIWEAPENVAELSAGSGVTVLNVEGSGAVTIDAPVPGLTDGVVDNLFANRHLEIAAFDSNWTKFMSQGADNMGVYREFASGGRIVITGPDDFFHGRKGAVGFEGNQYTFAYNKIDWASSGVPEPGLLTLLGIGLLGMGLARRKKAA